MANLFSVACQYLDIWSHKIFSVPRQKIKSIGLYWLIAYNITFLYRLFCFTFSHEGQQSKVPTRVGSRRQRCDAICNRGSRGFKLPQRGLGLSPSRKRFLKIFDRLKLVLINCLPCQKDCTRFWTSWWCCNLILILTICYRSFYMHRTHIKLPIEKLREPPSGISWDSNGVFAELSHGEKESRHISVKISSAFPVPCFLLDLLQRIFRSGLHHSWQ